MDLDWTFQMKNGLPKINRQSVIPGGSVEISHENLLGDSQSLSVSLSSSDWRNPAQDLGFQMSYTEPFYAPNTTRNLQVSAGWGMNAVYGWQGECEPGCSDSPASPVCVLFRCSAHASCRQSSPPRMRPRCRPSLWTAWA